MYKMTIKTKILTILLILVGIVSLSLLFSQYYFSEKIAIRSANDTFKLISQNISEHLRTKSLDTRRIVTESSEHMDLESKITFDIHHPALHGLMQVLQFKNKLHAIYFAQADGHYFEVIRMQDRPKMYEVLDAPPGTWWTVLIIIDNVQQNTFLSKNFEVLGEKRFAKVYDPRKRPWYELAVKSDRVIVTKPYLFALAGQMGVTYAKVQKKKGTVLAVDYTMEQLNGILARQKYNEGSEIFIVNEKGERYASSLFFEKENMHQEMRKKGFEKDFFRKLVTGHLDRIIKHKESGKNYYLILHPLLSKNTYLGIKLDADNLLAPYRENIRYSFMIAFLLLLLSVPVILLSAGSIAKPINALIALNHRIQARRLSEVKGIDTNIVELQELSDSLVGMSQSILAHEKAQEALLDSIIKLIAEAIDRKSPYTGKHCERVPELAASLLAAVNASTDAPFKDFSMKDKEDLRAFEIASWLHDCGKVTTPEYVVDKSVKLETIYNRIHEIRMRFEVLWRDLQLAHLRGELEEEEMHREQKSLLDDFAFIASVNLGSEYMSDEKKARVRQIAQREWMAHFDERLGLGIEELARYGGEEEPLSPVRKKLLCDRVAHIVPREHFDHAAYAKEGFKLEVPEYLYNYGEVYNLCIEKGTLTEEERYKINEHVIMSIKMLEKIPFPEGLTNIPEYAGTHHETLAGTGYPKKLSRETLSIPARIMAIADIFEALTASDRPYKKAKRLSEAIAIMATMAKEEHIDKDLFALFLRSGIYLKYAEKYLDTTQRDHVEIEVYLNQQT